MSLETATYIDSLVTSNPQSSDQGSTIDDHLRLIKASLKRTFPNVAGEVSVSQGELNYLRSATSNIQTQINAIKQGQYTANYALSASTALSAGYAASASQAGYAASAGYAVSAAYASIGAYDISPASAVKDQEYTYSLSNSTMAFYLPSTSVQLNPGYYRVEAAVPTWGVTATGTAVTALNLAKDGAPFQFLGSGSGGFNGSATVVYAIGSCYLTATAVLSLYLAPIYFAGGPDNVVVGAKTYLMALKLR